MEGPVGEFWHRYPERRQLHVNRVGDPLFQVGCHAHKFGHVRFLFASDQPGPDGRVGWLEKTWPPGTRALGLPPEERIVRGNGPDSARWIPAGQEHEFTLLSMTGYHLCFFHNRDPITNEIVSHFTGHMEATF